MAALICTQCGAGLKPGAASCEYCGTAYRQPGDFGGSEFSGHDDGHFTRSRHDCPRCHVVLHTHELGQSEIDRCPRCGGLWVTHEEMHGLLQLRKRGTKRLKGLNRPGGQATERKRSMWRRPKGAAERFGNIPCPKCSRTMRLELASTTGEVYVDICPRHGTWFDEKEMADLLRLHSRKHLRRRVIPQGAGTDSRRGTLTPSNWKRERGVKAWDATAVFWVVYLIAEILEEIFD